MLILHVLILHVSILHVLILHVSILSASIPHMFALRMAPGYRPSPATSVKSILASWHLYIILLSTRC